LLGINEVQAKVPSSYPSELSSVGPTVINVDEDIVEPPTLEPSVSLGLSEMLSDVPSSYLSDGSNLNPSNLPSSGPTDGTVDVGSEIY
jgi:hypothetical protein